MSVFLLVEFLQVFCEGHGFFMEDQDLNIGLQTHNEQSKL